MAAHRHPTVQDPVALVEIDLTAELMIAAAAAPEERLSPDRIDEVLDVDGDDDGGNGADGDDGAHPAPPCAGPGGRGPCLA